MEKIEHWLSQDKSAKVFKLSYNFNWLFELQRFVLNEKSRTELVVTALNEECTRLNTTLNQLSLYQNGYLIPQHTTIAASIDISRNEKSDLFNISHISGSGDGFTEIEAKGTAILELLERYSYYQGKYAFKFSEGFSFFNSKIISESHSPLSTTGYALEASPERAIGKAILESIERDAYLSHWYSGISPREICLDSDPIYALAKIAAESRGLTLRVYLLSPVSDEISVVLTTIHDPDNNTRTTFFCSGLAADFSIRKAFHKAYMELDRFARVGHRNLNQDYPTTDLERPMGRFFYYLDRTKIDDLRVFTSANNVQNISSEDLDRSIHKNMKSFLRHAKKMSLLSDAIIYPGPMLRNLSQIFFCCWAYTPQLNQLCYEWPPDLNIKRIKSLNPLFDSKAVKPHPLP